MKIRQLVQMEKPDDLARRRLAATFHDGLTIDDALSGNSVLYRLYETDAIITHGGEYLILMCLGGRDSHPMIIRIIAMAHLASYKGVKFYTRRKGMGKFSSRYGFVFIGKEGDDDVFKLEF